MYGHRPGKSAEAQGGLVRMTTGIVTIMIMIMAVIERLGGDTGAGVGVLS